MLMEMIAVGNKCQECGEANVTKLIVWMIERDFLIKLFTFVENVKIKVTSILHLLVLLKKCMVVSRVKLMLLVMAFREIGKGHESIKTFARCMSMHSISDTIFRNINNKLFSAYKNSAIESMQNAANKAKMEEIVPGIHFRVSIDGTWQKRGHSLNGVVTTVSKGKCLDVIVLRDNRIYKLESGK